MSERSIWNRLDAVIRNGHGTAGLMGNLYAESGLRSTNLQQSAEKRLNMTDDQYTAAVDDRTYQDFIRDQAGYGLAQWTYHSRKANLLEYAWSCGKSIGDEDMQVDFLLHELQTDYKLLFKRLQTAQTVREASDTVLTMYEQPKDQSERVKVLRASYGDLYYKKYGQSDRERILSLARSCVGIREGTAEHHAVVDAYNAVRPLPRHYTVKYTDAWCATFISYLSVSCGLTDIIPVECGCEEQIKLFQKIGSWVEDDAYTPRPGDIIYYDWQDTGSGDDTGHSDHVGIVESCDGLSAVVIEGNYSDQVKRRTISINGRYIRGYGVPKYKDGTAYVVGWNHDSKGWWYATSASTYYHGTWAVINHHWYYFGDDGYILTGVQNIGGKVYYLMDDGDLQGALCITDDKGSLFPWFVD